MKGQGFCKAVQNFADGRSRVIFMTIIKFPVLEKSMLMFLNSLFFLFLFISKWKKRNKKLRVLQSSHHLQIYISKFIFTNWFQSHGKCDQ